MLDTYTVTVYKHSYLQSELYILNSFIACYIVKYLFV